MRTHTFTHVLDKTMRTTQNPQSAKNPTKRDQKELIYTNFFLHVHFAGKSKVNI